MKRDSLGVVREGPRPARVSRSRGSVTIVTSCGQGGMAGESWEPAAVCGSAEPVIHRRAKAVSGHLERDQSLPRFMIQTTKR